MKRYLWAGVFLCACLVCNGAQVSAMSIEGAVGAWRSSPDGELSYEPITAADTLDIKDDMDFDDENGIMARLRIELPSLIPDVSLMYTGMSFEGSGSKNVSFNFGGETFDADAAFDSELDLNHFDAALFGSIPFLETASASMLNIDLGVNARVYFVQADIEQDATGVSESESLTLPIPMLYAAAQFKPFGPVSLEGEFRGIAYDDDHAYSLIGRARYTIIKGLFIAGGYRHDAVDFDEDDVDVDVTVQGPFLEAGFSF